MSRIRATKKSRIRAFHRLVDVGVIDGGGDRRRDLGRSIGDRWGT